MLNETVFVLLFLLLWQDYANCYRKRITRSCYYQEAQSRDPALMTHSINISSFSLRLQKHFHFEIRFAKLIKTGVSVQSEPLVLTSGSFAVTSWLKACVYRSAGLRRQNNSTQFTCMNTDSPEQDWLIFHVLGFVFPPDVLVNSTQWSQIYHTKR